MSYDALNARAYMFHTDKYLTKEMRDKLRATFSLYAQTSTSLFEGIEEVWQSSIFEYSSNTWFIFMDADIEFLQEEISAYLDNDDDLESAWMLFQIGDNYVGTASSTFWEWLHYHLGY